MGKKYIIELEDKPFYKGNGDFLYRVKGFNSLVFDMTGIGKLIPYTEPDLEQVRKEAYEQGRKDGKIEGRAEAWEYARKIQDTGGNLNWWIHNISASEAIEKIRQHEQEQKKIKVGDEVKSGDEKYIVLQKYLNNIDEPMAVLFNKRDEEISVFHLYNGNGAIFEKTGKHFHEITEVLAKMKEN